MKEPQQLNRPIVTRAALASQGWRAFLRPLVADLLMVLVLALLVVVGPMASYRVPAAYMTPIEALDGLDKDGLGEVEEGDLGWFRWSGPSLRMRFPGIGQAPTDVALAFHNPETASPRRLMIGIDRRVFGAYELRSGWQQVAVHVPAVAMDRESGDLNLRVQVDPPFDAGNRSLGVAISSIEVQGRGPAPAPLAVQTTLALLALLLVVPLRVLGVPSRWAGSAVAGLLLIALVLLATWRIGLVVSLVPIINALLISVLAVPLLLWWARSQSVSARPWAIGVAIVALGMFVARLAGMQHPQFVLIDHVLRVHQIQAIAVGQREAVQASLSQQYEWGRDVAVPYSLLAYDLFVPLATRLSRMQLLLAVEAVTAALDATIPLFLWDIARRNGYAAPTRWWSAALYGVMPVGYLYFHDGSYPTIIGLWITVVALWLVTGGWGLGRDARSQEAGIADRGLGRERGAGAGLGNPERSVDVSKSQFSMRHSLFSILLASAAVALSMLMYVTHLAFVPALGGAMIGSMLLLGVGPLRQQARSLAIVGGVGVLLAFLGYYGAQIPELVGNTIPAYLRALGGGDSVGRDAALLPGPLLGNAWQQLWGHYRVVVVGLGVVGVLLGLRDRHRPMTHLLVAYGIFLFLTTIADTRFGLWNKHMYFALPGVCLAAGLVLGELHQRGIGSRIVAWTLFGFLMWTSLEAWVLRVIWYVWSLETL